jgi:hypothetical protein
MIGVSEAGQLNRDSVHGNETKLGHPNRQVLVAKATGEPLPTTDPGASQASKRDLLVFEGEIA